MVQLASNSGTDSSEPRDLILFLRPSLTLAQLGVAVLLTELSAANDLVAVCGPVDREEPARNDFEFFERIIIYVKNRRAVKKVRLLLQASKTRAMANAIIDALSVEAIEKDIAWADLERRRKRYADELRDGYTERLQVESTMILVGLQSKLRAQGLLVPGIVDAE